MGYTLIISEKPAAAKKIAQALADGEVNEMNKGGAAFYKLTRGGKEIVVVPAVGHLFVLAEKNKESGWSYPVFDIDWIPTFTNKNSEWSKKYFENIQFLAKGASEIISATDYDIEGSTIAYNIIKFICKTEKAKRMKFSTLTKEDIVEAYENASPVLDFPQINAGLARHYLDWFWGINVSRALTLALRKTGGYKTLSTGRVQGPTLYILEQKDTEISNFKPIPFWQLELIVNIKGEELSAMHEADKIWKREDAQKIFDKCKNKAAIIDSTEKKKHSQAPPMPFDLTTLQREAYANFGYSPKQTLDVAQTLYEQALISYPRTSSQKLPAKIGLKNIISALSKDPVYSKFCKTLLAKKELKPNEGPKEDPAHPSIFPTGAKPANLNDYQAKIYDIIVKRFLATFADPAIRESVKVTIDVAGEKFLLQGSTTVESGWIDFYKPYAKFKEQLLPEVKDGEAVKTKSLNLLEKQTQPPNRYTQASVLKELEDLGLGTKSTRAQILQTLYDRNYIKEKSIAVTPLGKCVAEALEKYCPDIISVDLTRKFEADMEAIQEGKLKKEDMISAAVDELKKILAKFKKNDASIGKELLVGIRGVLKAENTIGVCQCGNDLVVRKSGAGKRFVGCTGYPNCTQTFSMPHEGSVTITHQKCQKCGLFIVSVKKYKKRPWKLCVKCGFVNVAAEKSAV